MALLNILLRLTHPLFKFKAEPFPQALAARLKLAKRGYTEIPAMASLKDQALPLLGTLAALGRQRQQRDTKKSRRKRPRKTGKHGFTPREESSTGNHARFPSRRAQVRIGAENRRNSG